MAAIVERYPASAIDVPHRGVFRHVGQDQLKIPMAFLPSFAVESIHLLQPGKGLPTALPANAWVVLTLDAVHHVHASLQFSWVLASAGFRPTFTRALRAFNHAIILRSAG